MNIQEKLKSEISNYQQVKRIEKVYNEEYYVLDSKLELEKIKIFISGSTQNVYEITIYKDTCKIWCDCPDMKSFSKRFDCICKHCCFVLLKIGKIYDSEPIVTKKINQRYQEIIIERLSQNELKNVELSMKYMNMKDSDSNSELKTSKFDSSTKELTEDDECPICYDLLISTDVKSCPECKNYVHSACINKWLKVKSTCVLCRSDCWSSFNKKTEEKEYISLK